ncbi:hypothetical protein [Anaerofustis stercorihominis]|uniref:Uncharacterized protein n=1 Tax=Anaerofustis stercorihominis TaxID=214853 RepID=A0A3E3E1T4_9FIRM|nr:hypothetical protein [Anaerofustis stercorihominis]RGD75306.1 hypothetical protein DW687_02980 [Anaerofustis stercorihominis]
MNSLIIVLVCIVLAVLIQFLLCKSDNILMGLIIPVVFALIAVMMSVVTKGNGLNKFTEFVQWFLPGFIALVIYFFTKKKKHDKRKEEKDAMKKLKEDKKLSIEASDEDEEIEEVEAEIIDEDN